MENGFYHEWQTDKQENEEKKSDLDMFNLTGTTDHLFII